MQIFIVVAVAIASALWGARVAQSKNRSPLGWGLLCFLLPIIGVIIVQRIPPLEAKPKPGRNGGAPKTWRCRSCGAENPESEPRCHFCETIKHR
jgi:hypothetical protein